MKELSCFKTYDIRGIIGENLDENIVYNVGRSVAEHFGSKSIVLGFDARETSASYADFAAKGIMDAGSDVIMLGLAGTEEMYWAVTEFEAGAGIEITASHNPINENGMKIVKSRSRPLDPEKDFNRIRALASSADWEKNLTRGQIFDLGLEARDKYVEKILTFINPSKLHNLKIVVNCGNGAAGPTFDAVSAKLFERGASIDICKINHDPDPSFPNGIPNPLLVKNHAPMSEAVKKEGADLGIAFDGDFDRCFFFDGSGRFIPGEYIVNLLASIFLEKEPGGTIIHDPRVIWGIQDTVRGKGGKAVQSKTGHALVKQTMRREKAVYGGEMSAHHYFRDFAYCDSGMLPWLLIIELIAMSRKSLELYVDEMFEKYPSSGERNFWVKDPDKCLSKVRNKFKDISSIESFDGISFDFSNWRFNLRMSNTEPLIRLNVEGQNFEVDIEQKVSEIAGILEV